MRRTTLAFVLLLAAPAYSPVAEAQGIQYRPPTISGSWVSGTPVLLPAGTAAAKPLAWATMPGVGLYIPDQTLFSGTFILGPSGGALSNTGAGNGEEGQHNTYIGLEAGTSSTTGQLNTFIGNKAGLAATTSRESTLVGAYAGLQITTGNSNACFGSGACQQTTTGHTNTMIGGDSGLANIDGYENVFVGTGSGAHNTSGYSNVYIGGRYAGAQATTGFSNVAIGSYALNNGNGSKNIAIGYSAGRYETGSNKLFIDGFSGRNNEAGDRAGAIIYGIMGATPADQSLTINALHVNVGDIPTYANNAAALAGGLVAGDLYTVTGTDPRQIAITF
jgi:hypothetical protein